MERVDVNLIRVLHCPHQIGGQAANVARHERALGLDSVAIAFAETKFGYPTDEILWDVKSSRLEQERGRWRLFARALKYFDVVHYNFGCPILNWGGLDGRHRWMGGGLGGVYASLNMFLELPMLKLARKVVAVTYQGDDARQGDYSRKNYEFSIAQEVEEEEDYYSPGSDAGKRKRIARFSEYADLMYAANPDLLNVLPPKARFLPYAHIDLKSWVPLDSGNSLAVPHVVHAPSHKNAKGTKYILTAVERLKSEGIQLRFTLVEGLSNTEARRVYETADLFVDQLLAGFYGGVSVEMMALGKPVICYLRESDMHYLPPAMSREMPFIKADPQSIYEVLRQWLTTRKDELHARGLAGRSYVERWHDPFKIAGGLKNDYQQAFVRRQSGLIADL